MKLPLTHDKKLDWGFIRDGSHELIYTAKIPLWICENKKLNEHRRNKTDPTQPYVDALLSAFEIAQELAEWSEKYPRTLVSFSAKVDEQLIAIEEKAKRWLDAINKEDKE